MARPAFDIFFFGSVGSSPSSAVSSFVVFSDFVSFFCFVVEVVVTFVVVVEVVDVVVFFDVTTTTGFAVVSAAVVSSKIRLDMKMKLCYKPNKFSVVASQSSFGVDCGVSVVSSTITTSSIVVCSVAFVSSVTGTITKKMLKS